MHEHSLRIFNSSSFQIIDFSRVCHYSSKLKSCTAPYSNGIDEPDLCFPQSLISRPIAFSIENSVIVIDLNESCIKRMPETKKAKHKGFSRSLCSVTKSKLNVEKTYL